jgi:MinD-like ATPase involved in chromosome partitioning or flagellar assembly
VTTNNDTPQIFGPGAAADDDFSADWRDILAGQPAAETHDDEDAGDPDEDQAHPAGNGWAGWGERAEPPAAPGYPQPAPAPAPGQPGYPPGPGYAVDAGYAADAGYARQLGYPQDPGYGPEPGYAPEAGYEPGYGPEAGYEPDAGYQAEAGPEQVASYPQGGTYRQDGSYPEEAGYPDEAGYPEGTGYLPDLGFAADPGAVPTMEPLPDLGLPEGPGPATFPAAPVRDPAAAGVRGGIRPDARASRPPQVPEPEPVRETSDSLTTESLLHGKRAAPGSGWRRNVYRATGGLLRFGESTAEMRRRDLINRVRTPVAGGHHRVAVLSLKGGVGKTTTTVGLGATLATLRGDRVIALDANPDRGTLSDKVRLETAATIRDLLNERDQVRRYADVRAFTSQAPSRLEVLASDRDPGVSVAFGADDYCDAARVLEHFYSICITDCGTGLLHSAMSGVLRLADQIVLVSSPSVDGARSASATLDWLEAHRCGDLVRNAVVVLSAIRPKSKSTVDLDRLEHHFAARCRAVTRIPYDPHLEEGAEVELELLASDTAEAYLSLAAFVGDGLAWPRRLTSRPALP